MQSYLMLKVGGTYTKTVLQRVKKSFMLVKMFFILFLTESHTVLIQF
jgi:hypothetical protein